MLADPSRYAIYQEISRSELPLSTSEIAKTLDLHPSTVRLHLDKLREADLVRPAPDRHGTVGRPQYRWSLGGQVSALGAEPDGFRLLSHLLAELNAHSGSRPETALDTGRQSGLERIAIRSGRDDDGAGRGGAGRDACLRVVLEELSELGFDPSMGAGLLEGDVVAISFQRCPFREVAVLYPDLVCQLHRGITEGILERVCAVAPDPWRGWSRFPASSTPIPAGSG